MNGKKITFILTFKSLFTPFTVIHCHSNNSRVLFRCISHAVQIWFNLANKSFRGLLRQAYDAVCFRHSQEMLRETGTMKFQVLCKTVKKRNGTAYKIKAFSRLLLSKKNNSTLSYIGKNPWRSKIVKRARDGSVTNPWHARDGKTLRDPSSFSTKPVQILSLLGFVEK